jgi:hypothetical protein
MDPLDAFWHLLNFFAPALGVAGVAALWCKLLWRRLFAAISFKSLFLWCAGAGAVVLVAGLLVFGRDGRRATYGALVLAMATVLWLKAFRKA